MTGTVLVLRTYFREEEVFEGTFLDAPSTYTNEEKMEGITAIEAHRAIAAEGLTFEATGGSWAAHPDGTRELFYTPFGRDEGAWRVETSAHLSGWHPRVETAIINAIDTGRVSA